MQRCHSATVPKCQTANVHVGERVRTKLRIAGEAVVGRTGHGDLGPELWKVMEAWPFYFCRQ